MVDLINANRADLATILTGQQGKPYIEALGEIDYAAAYVEFYIEEAKRIAANCCERTAPMRASWCCAGPSAWWRRSRRGPFRQR